jgi:hypothetical protein
VIRDELTVEASKLHRNEFRDLRSSPDMVSVVK